MRLSPLLAPLYWPAHDSALLARLIPFLVKEGRQRLEARAVAVQRRGARPDSPIQELDLPAHDGILRPVWNRAP